MSLQVDIHKKLGAFTLDVALEASVEKPEVLGLLGASGCGKSYTLKCIAGIETPDKGRIVLDGETLFDSEKGINLPPQKRRVGYLFQNYALFPNMTVRQNILCGLRWEKNKQAREGELQRVLALLRLEGLEKHRPYQLSGGQAQRVALGRILVNRPRLLMLDEPFSALDSHLRDKLQLELQELLAGFGRPVLLVTHSRDEVYRLCSKLLVIDHGQAVSSGNTKEIFADPQRLSVARLTGCKNFSRAQRLDDQTVEAIDWQIRLKVKPPFPENFDYIGIRAHDFYPWQEGMPEDNRLPCHLINRSESPFEKNIIFTTVENVDKPPRIWWLYGRYEYAEQLPQYLGIAPENILLLSSQQPTVSSLTAAAQQLP